jgi:hypothetical protein
MSYAYGTSNVLAVWQGFVSGGVLTTRAGQNCTLTRLSAGRYQLQINQWLDDSDTEVSVCAYNAPGGVYTQEELEPEISWNLGNSSPNGAAIITWNPGGDLIDYPGLFNIVVTQCTDFVNTVEGNP